MSLNWKEIDRILDELDLQDSFLQDIRQYDFHHLLFQFYNRSGETTLLVSLQPGALRIHSTERKRKALPKPPRFTTFLKARVKGGKVSRIEQIGQERIILLNILRAGESFNLYIKLWENNANLIMTDQNHTILDCFSRRPNRKEVPGQKYDPRTDMARAASSTFDPDKFSLREFESKGDYNRQIEKHYGQKESSGQLENLRKEALRSLKAERKRLKIRLEKLENRQSSYDNYDNYRKWGDLIMANVYRMNKGEKRLDVTSWDEEGVEFDITIELDPLLSPAENGERYYKRYKKALAGKDLVADERKQIDRRITDIEQELTLIPAVEDRDHLRELITLEKQRKGKNDSPTPGLQFHSGPFLILVGRNSQENDQLLRHHVRGNDMWLHNRDWPGGYVFIKTIRGKSIPLETLLDGANLAIHYSRGKKAGKADLYYTEVKYLRRAKGAVKGTVLPTRERNLTVDLDPKRIGRLLG